MLLTHRLHVRRWCIDSIMYKGTAPVFITTKPVDLERLEKWSRFHPETQAPWATQAAMLYRRLKVYRISARVARPQRGIPARGRFFALLFKEQAFEYEAAQHG